MLGMNCILCTRQGAPTEAVAICPNCHAGLCLMHVEETARHWGPGGTDLSCDHHTWEVSAADRAVSS